MCESGKQCYEGESCRARMDQLKRLIWVLMIWVSILSLGLGAFITLHVILCQRSDTASPPNSLATTESQLSSYDCFDGNKNDTELNLLWRKKNKDDKANTTIKIEADGNYFLFLRVTLQSRKQGFNYMVTIKKTPEGNHATTITVGHIHETDNSTGLMGIGVRLSKNTSLNVICSPPAPLDVQNTYFGLIKF